MNRLYKILVLVSEVFLSYIMFIKKTYIPCVVKTLFNVSCPACGLTRAFRSILSLNIIKSFNYNILGFPIFIIIIFINLYLIYDVIFNRKETNVFLKKIGKHYSIIIIISLINMIINNIRGI